MASTGSAQGIECGQCDVFLSYHSADHERVNSVKRLLGEHGVRAFLDRSNLVAGLPWPQALEQALRSVRAVLVFVGASDGSDNLGAWQEREVWFAIDRQVEKKRRGESFPVIPVLLPGARPEARFLFLNTWVDLREKANEALAVQAVINALNDTRVSAGETALVTVCPYRGLETFREEHSAFFFGRESFAQDLLQRVTQRPLVALIGSSGSGKSSVIQAGLLPLLHRRRPPENTWDAVVFRPGDAPFRRLAISLIPLIQPEANEIDRLEVAQKLEEKWAGGAVRLEDVVERAINKAPGMDRLLIVVDQFEELFTLTPLPQRQPFLAAMMAALDRAPFTILLALRADFYGHAIAADRNLSDRMQSGLVNLGPMTRDELRRAVEEPLHKVDMGFEAGLVDRILDHVEEQPGSLPLLEFAVTQLWDRRDGRRITHAAYEVIGGVEGAISHRADSVFLSLDEGQKRAALSLFSRLLRVTELSESGPSTRRRLERDALSESERSVLQSFVDARLLVLDRGESAGVAVELAHEALIHAWRRLGDWVEEQREFLLWRQRLGQALAEWQRTGGDKSGLLRGPALKEAETGTRQRTADLSAAEQKFIGLSRRVKLRRRRWLAAGVGLLAIIAAALFGLQIAYDSNRGVVWKTMRMAPLALTLNPSDPPLPSAVAGWIHAMDVAGRLDDIGVATFNVPEAPPRFRTLGTAAILMASDGRTAEANRLADRALALVKEIPGFDSSASAQMDTAGLLKWVDREQSARPFALRGLALGREQQDPQARAFAVADAAQVLARVGLTQDATAAVQEARSLLGTAYSPTRFALADLIATALARLGAVDESVALVSGRPGWPVPVRLVELLVERGELKAAKGLVDGSDDPLGAAVLASAAGKAGQSEEAMTLARAALTRLNKANLDPDEREVLRMSLYKRLLLQVMTADKAVEFVGQSGDPEALATLAVALARSRQPALGRDVALLAAARARTGASQTARARTLVRAAEALARSGSAEQALTTAAAIEGSEARTLASAYAAYGFACQGNKDKAQKYIREVTAVLPSIRGERQQSSVFTALAMAHIQLGNYAAAWEHEGIRLTSSDLLSIFTAMITDDAIRRNAALRDAFEREQNPGLGRYGLHWP